MNNLSNQNNKRILILGASGKIGNTLYHSIKKHYYTVGTYFNNQRKDLIKFDINKNSLFKLIKKKSISHIILCQGIVNFDQISKDPKKAEDTNLKSLIKQLKEIKDNNSINVIFFSSESIFDGNVGNYTEESSPNPIFSYGNQKLVIENFIKSNFQNHLILRLSKVYDSEINEQKSLIVNWFNLLNNSQKVEVAIDNFITPIHKNDLMEFIIRLITKDAQGTYNISSDDNMSRSNFFEIFYEKYCLYFNTKSLIEKKQLNIISKKNANIPKKTSLNNRKVKQFTGHTPKSFSHYCDIFFSNLFANDKK